MVCEYVCVCVGGGCGCGCGYGCVGVGMGMCACACMCVHGMWYVGVCWRVHACVHVLWVYIKSYTSVPVVCYTHKVHSSVPCPTIKYSKLRMNACNANHLLSNPYPFTYCRREAEDERGLTQKCYAMNYKLEIQASWTSYVAIEQRRLRNSRWLFIVVHNSWFVFQEPS